MTADHTSHTGHSSHATPTAPPVTAVTASPRTPNCPAVVQPPERGQFRLRGIGPGGARVDLSGRRVEDVVGLPRRSVEELSVDDIAEPGIRHSASAITELRNR